MIRLRKLAIGFCNLIAGSALKFRDKLEGRGPGRLFEIFVDELRGVCEETGSLKVVTQKDNRVHGSPVGRPCYLIEVLAAYHADEGFRHYGFRHKSAVLSIEIYEDKADVWVYTLTCTESGHRYRGFRGESALECLDFLTEYVRWSVREKGKVALLAG